jgi:hypothetical protein
MSSQWSSFVACPRGLLAAGASINGGCAVVGLLVVLATRSDIGSLACCPHFRACSFRAPAAARSSSLTASWCTSLMQETPLLIHTLIDHAARYHGQREIVTLPVEGGKHRTTWAEIGTRSKQVANALLKDLKANLLTTGAFAVPSLHFLLMQVKPGDRVATLAWNTHRHLELYYSVSCIGAVLHTVNPRLFPEQIEFIMNHAEDKVMFVGEQHRCALVCHLSAC